jgi:hypothetical protein
LKNIIITVIDERDSQDIAEFLDDADTEFTSEFDNSNAGTISVAEKRSLQRQGKNILFDFILFIYFTVMINCVLL